MLILILTTGHLKDPAGSPDHGQTQNRAVEVQLISGEGSFNPHGDADTHTNTHILQTCWNQADIFTRLSLIPPHSPSLWMEPGRAGGSAWGLQQAAVDAIKASVTMQS